MFFKYLRDETVGNLFCSRDAFKYLQRGMKCVAWMPPKRGTRFYWLYIMWMIWFHFSAEIYLPIMIFISYIINFKVFKPQELLGSVQVFFNATSLTFKVAVNLMNMWRFERIMQILDKLDKRCAQAGQRIELHRNAVRCNLAFLLFQATFSIYATSAFLGAALTGSTPWVSYNPFVDYRTSTKDLWIAAVTEYIIGSCAIYADQTTDIYPVIFGLTLRTHLKLLAGRVENLRTDPELTEEQNYEQLVNCIKDHKLMLQYCDLLRSVISYTFSAQLLVIGLGLGLSMTNLMFFLTFWSGFSTIMFISVLIIQTFPFCYVCEMIQEDCYNLNLAIFYSKSFNASRRYKSTLFFFLQNAQKPIKFIAGDLFPICMKTNLTFAKFAFSVVTVIKQTNIIEKLKLH